MLLELQHPLRLAITGVSTFTGAIDANGDLDVDGHTNLDNVSIAGVTTHSGSQLLIRTLLLMEVQMVRIG